MIDRYSSLSHSKIAELVILGALFVFLVVDLRQSGSGANEPAVAPVQAVKSVEYRPLASLELTACVPATFGFQGKTYEEIDIERRAFLRAEAIRRANAWPTQFVEITKKMKNPNSVKIPFAQAPGISAKTREVNGRRVCEDENDKGNKSKQSGKGAHIDRECCLDPDEIPNPRCYYPELGANNSPVREIGPDGVKRIK